MKTVGLVVLTLASIMVLTALITTSSFLGVTAATCTPAPHKPILIRSDGDLTVANGVTSGTGTSSDPYVIGYLKLDDLSPGYGLKVDNSKGKITKYFNVQCVQSNFKSTAPSGAKLIWLVKIHTATRISDVSANPGEAPGSTGVQLDSSSNVILDSLSIEKFGYDGVLLSSSAYITVVHTKLKAMHNGLTIKNSHDITVGSICNLAAGSDCNEFTYDNGRGIHVLNSYNVNIQYTITSADDTGGVLLDGKGTYNVQLTNGVASGNGPICPSGTPTGEREDSVAGLAIVNGAYDINVSGYTLQGNAHYDMMNGGNGLYPNPCTGQLEHLGKATAPGGANLNVNGNCYGSQYGFVPAPTKNCPRS